VVKTDLENSTLDSNTILYFTVNAQPSNYYLAQTLIKIKNIKVIQNDGTELDYGSFNKIVNVITPNGNGILLNQQNFEIPEVNIFPNPTSNNLYIQTDDPISHLALFDIYGKKVLEQKTAFSNNQELIISNLPTGVYFLKINFDGKEVVRKIVKQ